MQAMVQATALLMALRPTRPILPHIRDLVVADTEAAMAQCMAAEACTGA